jgi:eukaryotic-like serine/threonine-protein kinase
MTLSGNNKAEDLMLGRTIGNYRISAKIGQGGMGSVYVAEHPQIGKKVALKVLHAEYTSSEDVVVRFFNEAKAVNDIGHPNIVDILDFGSVRGERGENIVYFIMEYLNGISLSQLLRQEGTLPTERALSIILQCADALAASHRCNIVHRDLKPDNVMIQQRGREQDVVKLLDFGIAKLGSDQTASQRTRPGLVMGTPAYMSPEQCEGKGHVDHRTDIYSLAVVLYKLLAGRLPFVGSTSGEVLVQHLTQQPPPLTTFVDVPPHVEAVVLKAMSKAPSQRFPNMDEFMRALANPVVYVDSRGGIPHFQQQVLSPSVGIGTPSLALGRLTPMPGASAPIPSPLTILTPPSLSMLESVPSMLSAEQPREPRKLWPRIVVGGIALGLGSLLAVVLSGKTSVLSSDNTEAVAGGAPVVSQDARVSERNSTDAAEPSAIITPSAKPKKVTIVTVPSGATVTLGQESGLSPFTTNVDDSTRSISVTAQLDGFEARNQTFELEAKTRVLNIDWRLKKTKSSSAKPGNRPDKPVSKPGATSSSVSGNAPVKDDVKEVGKEVGKPNDTGLLGPGD